MKRERQRHRAVLALVLDFRIEVSEQANLALAAETNDIAARELLGRLDQGLPARAVEPLDQRRLDLRFGLAADPPPLELRRDDLGVVDDELVARLQPLRQIGYRAVVQARPGLDHQHPRAIAWDSRPQRDPLGRQFEVEEIGAHGLKLANSE